MADVIDPSITGEKRITASTRVILDTPLVQNLAKTWSIDENGILILSGFYGTIVDVNGNEILKSTATASAVNEVTITNAATLTSPKIKASGETNVWLLLAGKWTGKVQIGDGADNTKVLTVELVWATTAKTMTVVSAHTDDRTITLPNATDTLVGKATTDNLTNKTLMTVTADKTITPALTVWAQTINKPAGTVNFAAWASSLVVTNSLVTTSSLVFCEIRTADATLISIKSVVCGSGSFTITWDEAATAETSVWFFVVN